MLALTEHDARRWEPKPLRLRLFTIPATLARTARRVVLHVKTTAPWGHLVDDGVHQLRALAAPGWHRPARPDDPSTPPASGTDGHPRRRSGHCHTQLPESPHAGGHDPRRHDQPNGTKDPG